jgi:hypothetical protein
MSETRLSWYSINSDLNLVEHDPVGLDEAIQIVDRYMTHADEVFEYAEDALAATMFGFKRTEKEFIEICVHGSDLISFKHEAPVHGLKWYQWLWRTLVRQEDDEEEYLESHDELVERISNFFRMAGVADDRPSEE